MYISHANGYTSVYAHLQRYEGEIENYIKKLQYSQKSYEVESYLPSDVFKIKKGQLIAFTGNTGGSGGPHLHFEIRDTKTEKIVNPMFFGLSKIIKDERKPDIHNVIVYPLSDSTVVNKGNAPIALTLVKQQDGSYLSNKIFAKGKIGFGINTSDMLTNAYNRNGVFKVASFVNGSPHFSYQFDSFSFDESKYINYFIDFKRYAQLKQRFQKLFIKENYSLSLIESNKKGNFIDVKPNTNLIYKIEISDFHGNKSLVVIPIEFKDAPIIKPVSNGKFYIKFRNDYNFEFESSSVYLPPNAFYENCYFNAEEENGVLILDNKEAIQHALSVTFDISNLSEEDKSKAFIASLNGYQLEYNSSFRKENKLTAKIKSFGKYKVALDKTPPRIFNPNFIEGSNISDQKTLQISISDALSGIESFYASINGTWILMEYDYKTKKLIHTIADGKLTNGKNEFKLIVTDKLNNTASYTSTFEYYDKKK